MLVTVYALVYIWSVAVSLCRCRTRCRRGRSVTPLVHRDHHSYIETTARMQKPPLVYILPVTAFVCRSRTRCRQGRNETRSWHQLSCPPQSSGHQVLHTARIYTVCTIYTHIYTVYTRICTLFTLYIHVYTLYMNEIYIYCIAVALGGGSSSPSSGRQVCYPPQSGDCVYTLYMYVYILHLQSGDWGQTVYTTRTLPLI